jgi:hypothetical protein
VKIVAVVPMRIAFCGVKTTAIGVSRPITKVASTGKSTKKRGGSE